MSCSLIRTCDELCDGWFGSVHDGELQQTHKQQQLCFHIPINSENVNEIKSKLTDVHSVSGRGHGGDTLNVLVCSVALRRPRDLLVIQIVTVL